MNIKGFSFDTSMGRGASTNEAVARLGSIDSGVKRAAHVIALRLSLDPVAALARAEYIIELMDECYIAENWSPPNRADAERFLQYFRDVVQARDWCEDGEEFAFVVNFCRAHYQPLDWVLRGDVSGMIAKLARASSPHR